MSKLAICVPTYNRAKKIREFLWHTVMFASKWDIEIFIADNASTDNTADVVGEFAAKYKYVHYHRHTINKGWLFNFDYVLHWPEAEYHWLCGDDDLLVAENIPLIYDAMTKKPSLIIANGGKKKSDNTFVTNAYKGDGIIYYRNKDELLGDLGYYMSWMSCLIFSNSLVKNIHFYKYKWTAFPHMVSILDYMSDKEYINVIYVSNPCVYVNDFESGGSDYVDKALGYFTKEWYLISESFSGYSARSREKFLIGHRDNVHAYTLKEFIVLRLLNYFNYKRYKEYKDYMCYCTYLPLWLIRIIAIAPPLLPKQVYCKLKLFKHWLKRRIRKNENT